MSAEMDVDATLLRWNEVIKKQAARIEKLEKALRDIAEENIGNNAALSVYIARAALEERT